MTWTQGHNWVAEGIRFSEIQGDPTYFTYKYALLSDGKLKFFEKGFNRIADLKLLSQDCLKANNNYELVNNKLETHE